MFFREKKSGSKTYLQIVENRREDGKVKQRVIATLGCADELLRSGNFDSLLLSGAKYSQALMVISAHKKGKLPVLSTRRIGSSLIFERLWEECGCKKAIKSLLLERKFEFDVERALFLTVLHRIFESGSDRSADKWRFDYQIDKTDGLQLHQLYRAMAWLGEEVPVSIKDRFEEWLFSFRRDLFASLDLVFFDTTSIYFEGEGGKSLGEYGNSKDHRSDRRQLIVGAVLDDKGQPVCCEILPGNTADVSMLIPVVKRLKQRFGIKSICIVADRGMVSKGNIAMIEELGWHYILGARMRKDKVIGEKVLNDSGEYTVVHPKTKDGPSPLEVKEVKLEEGRFIICFNEDQAKKDVETRKAIIESLRIKLDKGEKTLVSNKGYRRYLKVEQKSFSLDEEKIEKEAMYDGKYVLRTNTNLDAAELALKYKQLWMVEDLFKRAKSFLETRPVYHRCDETIKGHVFCSFLSLVMMKTLENRLEKRGYKFEWHNIIRDLDSLEEIEIEHDGKRFFLRNEMKGNCGKIFQSVGVAMPKNLKEAEV